MRGYSVALQMRHLAHQAGIDDPGGFAPQQLQRGAPATAAEAVPGWLRHMCSLTNDCLHATSCAIRDSGPGRLLAPNISAMTPGCTPLAVSCLHAVQVQTGLAGLEVSDERPGIAALELGDMLATLGLPGQAGTAWQQGLVALQGWTAAMGLKEMQVLKGGIDSVLRWQNAAASCLPDKGLLPLLDEHRRPSLLFPAQRARAVPLGS